MGPRRSRNGRQKYKTKSDAARSAGRAERTAMATKRREGASGGGNAGWFSDVFEEKGVFAHLPASRGVTFPRRSQSATNSLGRGGASETDQGCGRRGKELPKKKGKRTPIMGRSKTANNEGKKARDLFDVQVSPGDRKVPKEKMQRNSS